MAMGAFTASKNAKKSSMSRSGSLACRKWRRMTSSGTSLSASWYRLFVSMNSSKRSVQRTTVLGMVTVAFSNDSNST